MSLHAPTAVAARRPRLGLVASVVVAGVAAGAATVVIADEQSTSTTPHQAAATRYLGLEANKANSMRALGRHIAEQRANQTSRYDEIEANKARSQRAR